MSEPTVIPFRPRGAPHALAGSIVPAGVASLARDLLLAFAAIVLGTIAVAFATVVAAVGSPILVAVVGWHLLRCPRAPPAPSPGPPVNPGRRLAPAGRHLTNGFARDAGPER